MKTIPYKENGYEVIDEFKAQTLERLKNLEDKAEKLKELEERCLELEREVLLLRIAYGPY